MLLSCSCVVIGGDDAAAKDADMKEVANRRRIKAANGTMISMEIDMSW